MDVVLCCAEVHSPSYWVFYTFCRVLHILSFHLLSEFPGQYSMSLLFQVRVVIPHRRKQEGCCKQQNRVFTHTPSTQSAILKLITSYELKITNPKDGFSLINHSFQPLLVFLLWHSHYYDWPLSKNSYYYDWPFSELLGIMTHSLNTKFSCNQQNGVVLSDLLPLLPF